MPSQDSYQQPSLEWTSQHHQRASISKADDCNSYGYYAPIQGPYHNQYQPKPEPYIQPYYGDTQTAPIIAELPAPLPPAPPTTTSDQQVKEDQLLANKLQQLEVAEVRSRSNSAISIRRRPVSTASPSLTNHSPLVHQASSLSLRPYSTNMSASDPPWSPGSFGTQRNLAMSSMLPEVVPEPRHASYDPSNDLPIPVATDQRSTGLLQPVLSRSTSLPLELETYRQVSYPPMWRLPPVVATFFAYGGSKIEPNSDWLSQQETFTWRTIRPTEHAYNPSAPSYTFKFATKGGSFRDPRFSWVMTLPAPPSDPKKKVSKAKQPSWTYDLRLDLSGGMRKKEVLNHGSKTAILTTYVHASNYDSLRFIGPDGRGYMWVSSSQVSSVDGLRYDIIRHALFGAVGQIQDPLYGEIVADHTFWDGYVDEDEVHKGVKCDGCQTTPIRGPRFICKVCHKHDVCDICRKSIMAGGFGAQMQKACKLSLVCLPDEALYIRSPLIDPALVVATLQVLKDWERHTLRDQKRTNPKGFLESEDEARKHDLGIMSYWKASDWDKKDTKNTVNAKMGTVVKARSITAAFEGSSSALGGLVDAGFALAGHGTGSNAHGGSHGGDGGGEGGGGGS